MKEKDKNPGWCTYKGLCPFWGYLDDSCEGCYFHEDEVKKRKELRESIEE